MEGGPFPILYAGNESVLDRIEVNIIDTVVQFLFRFDRMFPKTALPNGTLSLADPRSISMPFIFAVSEVVSREILFELLVRVE